MAKLIDLTGKRFYELTVVSKLPPDGTGRTKWNCICSCGNPVIATGYDLKNGKHKSCGHDRIYHHKDLTGQTFGDLYVEHRNTDGTWHCKCSCGNYIDVLTYALTSGHTKGCGHSRKFIDLTGKTIGEWTVLKYLGNSMWECRCSCGKVAEVHSYSLRNERSLSCGHNKESKLLEDLTGKQFNDWTVLRYIGGNHSKWLCKCICGTEKEIAAYDLKNGKTRNCGHNRKNPYNDLTGKIFGHLTVLKYIGKGMYTCQCECGNVKNILGCNLKSGETIACGCKQLKTKYTKEVIEAAILDYKLNNGEAPFNTDLSDKLNITTYYVNSLVNKYGLKQLMNTKFGSRAERDIFNYVASIIGFANIIHKDRTALGNGQELDIYIPNKQVAIEFNGNYWHRETAVGKQYHLEKTKIAISKGIRLIHIFEYEWNDLTSNRKIKEIIKRALTGVDNVIYARQCNVKLINRDEEYRFLTDNHIQGYTNSKLAYGLYTDDELVSIMSFGIPRFNSEFEWELLRYCNKTGVGIVGGAEKLIKYFKENNKPKSIISYVNIAKFTGQVYNKLGFKADDITPPNYVWTYGNEVLTRYQTQKQTLLDKGLGVYGDTENEIMETMGYERIYDCGNIRYSWYA